METRIGTLGLLVSLVGAPLMWSIHLGASYLLVALDCGSRWDGGRIGIVVTTVICTVGALGAGGYAWRKWRLARDHTTPGDLPDPQTISGFLTLSGALLSLLFAGTILLAGMSAVFLPMCS